MYKRRNPTRRERRSAGKRASQRAEKGVAKSLFIVLGLFAVVSLALLVVLWYVLS
jgi:cell division septal protein FtsQ